MSGDAKPDSEDLLIGAAMYLLQEHVIAQADKLCASYPFGRALAGGLLLGLARVLVQEAESRGVATEEVAALIETKLMKRTP